MSITDSNSVAIDDSIVLEYYPVPRDEMKASSIGRGPIVLGVATSVDGNEFRRHDIEPNDNSKKK